jgi:hypothetical protein
MSVSRQDHEELTKPVETQPEAVRPLQVDTGTYQVFQEEEFVAWLFVEPAAGGGTVEHWGLLDEGEDGGYATPHTSATSEEDNVPLDIEEAIGGVKFHNRDEFKDQLRREKNNNGRRVRYIVAECSDHTKDI